MSSAKINTRAGCLTKPGGVAQNRRLDKFTTNPHQIRRAPTVNNLVANMVQ